MNVSEPWQILNYGIGGEYRPHHDFFKNVIFELFMQKNQNHPKYFLQNRNHFLDYLVG